VAPRDPRSGAARPTTVPQPVEIHDRISGQPVRDSASLPRRHPLGRYAVLPGTSSLLLDGRTMRPGEYLAGASRWRLKIGEHPGTVVAEHGDSAMPAPALVGAVRVIGTEVALRLADGRPVADLVAVSPVINQAEAEQRLDRQALEEALEGDLRYLAAVCFRPAIRLRPVNRLLPVSRSRRITPATVVRLAAHSEDWARVRPDGVQPEHVLTPQREFDVDLYENRVAARLAEHLRDYLAGRIAELQTLTGTFTDAQRYIDDAASRPFYAARDLWLVVTELVKDLDWPVRVAERLRELQQLRDDLDRLRNSPLWRGVDHRAEVGMALRSTNLLTDDHRYRRVADLWWAWLADQGGILSAAERFAAVQDWCRMFEYYVGLLLLRAFEDAGLVPANPAAELARGGAPVPYQAGPVPAHLRWDDDGVFTVLRAGTAVLRLVPLPHALTASHHPDVVGAELAGLGGPSAGTPTVVVYPAERIEREALPPRLRLRIFETPGTPAPGRDGAGPYLLPASPLDVDSVVRLARVLRWSIEAPRVGHYPYRIDCSPADSAALGRLPWLEPEPRAVAIVRPPTDHERAALHDELQAMRKDADRARRCGSNAAHIDRLQRDLDTAADRTIDILRCPVCGKEQRPPLRTWDNRDDGYRISCDSCLSIWESRQCRNRNCGATYPALTPHAAELNAAGSPLDGDGLDRQVGSLLLAAPCWTRARVFICPVCATCGETISGDPAGCARCIEPSP
jgi:hypothetical protein